MALKEGMLLQEHPLLAARKDVVKLEVEADRPGNNIQHFLSNNKYLWSDSLWYKRTEIIRPWQMANMIIFLKKFYN